MKKIWGKLICGIISATMILGLPTSTVFAYGDNNTIYEEHMELMDTVEEKNYSQPISIEGVSDENDLKETSSEDEIKYYKEVFKPVNELTWNDGVYSQESVALTSPPPVLYEEKIPDCYSTTAAGEVLRESMINRNATCSFNFYMHGYTVEMGHEESEMQFNFIFTDATKHTGNSTEGDYLKWNFKNYAYQVTISEWWEEGFTNPSGIVIRYDVDLSYYTNIEQEDELTSALNELYISMGLKEKNRYERVYSIYDYICQNVDYDHEHLDDETYTDKYTAHAAFFDKKAVCQGYSNLLYRMMLDNGIECRIIAGDVADSSQKHSWNIVRMGNAFYFLDSTWDSDYYDVYKEYGYLLRGEDNFSDHIVDLSLFTDYHLYQISKTDFDISSYEDEEVDDDTTKVIASGKCGADINWFLHESGTMSIIGYGNMYDYYPSTYSIVEKDFYNRPWESYISDISTIVFKGYISKVGNYSFADCNNLKKIVFCDSITDIGGGSFQYCQGLEKLDLPSNILILEGEAFGHCNSIKEIVIPNSIQCDAGGFRFCAGLEKVTFERLSEIVQFLVQPFEGCTSLTDIEVLDGAGYWTSIDGVFYLKNDEGYFLISYPAGRIDEEYTIQEGTKRVWSGACSYAQHLKKIVVPEGTTLLDNYVFWNAKNLETIELPESLECIGPGAFNSTNIKTLTVPSNVSEIYGGAFGSCENLESVDLKCSIQCIPEQCFINCYNLTKVTIPEGVKSIDYDAFCGCYNLGEINIPESVQNIGSYAFMNCYKLKYVDIPEGVETIEKNVFHSCRELEGVILPNSIKSIESEAFLTCLELKEVLFNGTQEDFSKISISDGNGSLTDADWVFLKEYDGVLTGISIKRKPTKIMYLKDKETLNVIGGRILLSYDDGATCEIGMFPSMVTGFDNTKVGTQTLTVTYEGKTAFYDVMIKATQEEMYIKGDVNNDGQIDASDVTALARHVAKLTIINDQDILVYCCDTNGDGYVDAADVTHLARYVAKLISVL